MSRRTSFQRSSVCLLPLVVALWCFVGLSANADPSSSPVHPMLTADQAVKIASSFCSAVGAPVTEKGEATYPTPLANPEEALYWSPRWQVKFPGQATLQIEDRSGIIVDYSNDAYFAPPRSKHDSPAGKGITQSDAMARAASDLAATHFVSNYSEGLKLSYADEQQSTSPPTVSSHVWMITWQRTSAGIPFENQHLTIMMNAETGELVGLIFVYPSPTPISERNVAQNAKGIKPQKAAGIARKLLAHKGLPTGKLTDVSLQWICPDNYWTDKKTQPISQVPLKAWIVTVKDKETRYLVKVNAETGTIAGGETQGTLAAE